MVDLVDNEYIQITDGILNNIRKSYEEFKKISDYESRLSQRQFIDNIAQPVLKRLVEKEKIENKDLDALMQIFSVYTQQENFSGKLKQLGFDENFTEATIQEFQKLAPQGYKAYTWPGIARYDYDDETQLSTVLGFLKDTYYADSENELKTLIEDFNEKDIPNFRYGSYSPILHYIHPDKCPILNGPVEEFLKKLGWKHRYGYITAWNMLKQIKQAVGEDDYGLVDAFVNWVSLDALINNNTADYPSVNLLSKKKEIIFYGPPGTGKTYNTKRNALDVILMENNQELNQVTTAQRYDELKNKGQIEFITFHPSYSYEEFVEGITVDVDNSTDSSNELNFKLKDGIFKTMVTRALAGALDDDSDKPLSELINNYREQVKNTDTNEWWQDKPNYVIIIDEINRGDISKIFGELITLIEADKRLGMENELTVTLPYSQVEFGVPPNLYIIGTMNTADKSIALIDVALRRRFGFIEKSPDFDVVDKNHIEQNKDTLENNGVYEGLKKSREALEILNERICSDHNVGRDRQIGHSFLFKVWNQTDLIMVWENEILPLLEEYYYGQYSQINNLLFGNDGDKWVSSRDGIKGFSDYNDLIEFLDEVSK